MKAVRFVEIGKPMQLQDVPNPEPRPGWVVIRVCAAGLCHSDLHILDGSLTHTMSTADGTLLKTEPPITLGHETAGTVYALGEGVEGFELGERVISGGPMLPESTPGLTIDGGFAQYLSLPKEKVQRIPESVDFAMAAVATDSIATSYAAVRSTGALQKGETVGIIGLGGLGLNGVRAAVLLGGHVYGVDVKENTFDAARERGAKDCFTDVAQLAAVKPHLIVDFAGIGSTTEVALDVVRPGGRVVLVGLATDRASIRTHNLVLGRKILRGSLGRSPQDMNEVLERLAQGELHPKLTHVPFDKLNEGYEELAQGKVVGRLFTDPWA